jgi:uncharacterized protein (DUF2236 family)
MSSPSLAELSTLIALFYPSAADLGAFDEVSVQAMPDDYRQLLAHTSHMTVSVEEHHQSPVDVHVLDRTERPPHYARKILLSRQSDDRIVQFGIVRIDFTHVAPAVQAEIRTEKIPLGRVLINHNVLRRVRLLGLWRVTPGPALMEMMQLDRPQVTYGRTALIEYDSKPAVELLEIVTPLEVTG